jgi:hypothetical protein
MAGHPKVEVIEYINKGESLTKFYNRGLKEAKYDIVVFCHDDIFVETKQFAKKLVKLFDDNKEYGILGVAGSKFLGEDGKWWSKPKKMYGQVKHTHEGKSWLSSYSKSLGLNIEETIMVDGVFFSMHKDRIKHNFDETVNGFHFYDVDFCFNNYLSDVKIGVHTNIRINHKSIGQTNDEWEANRVIFSEKYKDILPVNIKRVIKPSDKIKVLIGCLSFSNHTGSELYVFDLAKELIKQNCEVSICSRLGEPLAKKAHSLGIKLYNLSEPPGYKLGDGKWSLNTPNGPVLSIDKKLYKIGDPQFDVLHLNHKPITEYLLKLYQGTPAIATIHSEVIELEEPVINEEIKTYITIRPQIKDFLIDKFNISDDKINVIYNPIDNNRFKPSNINKNNGNKKIILFVGTIDYLRKEMIIDLIKTTKNEGNYLWLVGKENDVKVSELIGSDDSHVTYHGPSWKVEDYIKKCDETAGILLGRTTIEGWMCGKPGWIYDINSDGYINNKTLHQVPDDISKYYSKNVGSLIIDEYKKIID